MSPSSTAQAHGVLVLHKPKGPTSARCISMLKRIGQKKIGHGGTLDPMAEGVLLVLLGQATKISGHLLTDGKKIYSGTIQLGQESDTWDAEGTITAQSPFEHITEEEVRTAIMAWLGKSQQIVPPYSAAKHQGQALYKLARAGKETPVKTKEIEISQVEVLDVRLPYVDFRVECSSGTYIRSLAHSLGKRLLCGAVLTGLTREYSHPFGLDQAHSLDAIMEHPEKLQQWLIPIAHALPHWPVLTLTAAEEARLKNGMPVAYREAKTQVFTHHATAKAEERLGNLPHGAAADSQDMDAGLCAQQAESIDRLRAESNALLLSEDGVPLALANKELVQNAPVWAVLRGLWTLD